MNYSLALTLSAISLLTACSTGGNGFNEDNNGNNGGNGGGPGATETMDVTSGNAMLVTKVSYQAALSSGAMAEFTTGTGLLASVPGGITKIDRSRAVSSKVGRQTANLVIPETMENCPEGGMMTFNGEIADPTDPLAPLTLTPGDNFNIFYEMCDDGFSVIDGNLFYEVDAFGGALDSGLYSLSMTSTFTDFQVTTLEDELVSNGDVTVRIDTLQFPYVEAEVSGNSLSIDGTTSALILTAFSSLHGQDTGQAPFPYTQSSSGVIDSTLLTGIVSYATPVEFEGTDADYPDSGVFVVHGINSSVRLIAVDNVNVLIEIDADGDTEYEETVETTWAELEAS